MQYHQPLRQTTSFVKSLLKLMGFGDFMVPDYSTLCRRQGDLPVELSNRWKRGEKIEASIDSTGLKIHGEGEWKVRQYGVSKRRTWRKLHVIIDIKTQQIIDVALTGNDKDDAATAREMLKGKEEKLKSLHGDGAYDDFALREQLKDVKQIIPPPKDAIVHQATNKKPVPQYLEQRNQAVEFINENDRRQWKIKENYHQRSLSEVGMFRFKTTFGNQMQARKIENQKTEAFIKAKI